MKVKAVKPEDRPSKNLTVRVTEPNLKMLDTLSKEYCVSRQKILNKILHKCFTDAKFAIEL